VDNGSTINSTIAQVTTGAVTVQGGSTWNHASSPMSIGLAPGGASLDITGNGSTLNLNNSALELGQIGDATVTVEHLGSIAATGSGGNLFVGLGSTPFFSTNSQMNVTSGGSVTANNISVEANAAATSTALLFVSDSGSSVTATDKMLVTLNGAVDAANHGQLSLNSLEIQTGSVIVESNASLDVSAHTDVLIGSQGTGSLTLKTGGTATSAGQVVVGGALNAVGTLTIANFGSKWDADSNISVGTFGNGTVFVQDSGVLKTGADPAGISGSIGTQSGAIGTVTVQRGGDWQAAGNLNVGDAGGGTLNILTAGTVESGDAVIGAGAGANGSAGVAGPGSKWTVSGDLTVGQNGTGALAISAGGVVTNVNATLGDKQGSSGSVTVTGIGSSWQNSGILTVGGDGAANLTINAGNVAAGGAAFGSNFAPVQVDITNNGSLNVLGAVSIGGGAATSFTVENGGTFDNVDADIGGSGGNTTVTISGPGSAWTLHGTAQLAIDDNGALFITDGGTVTADTITVNTGGLLNGEGGNIIGNVVNQGGTVTPGDATGITAITGNYTQTSGTLLFEIDGLGPGQFDQLLISGLANLTGGFIDIQFGSGFVPTAGESFDLLTAGLGLTLSNVAFEVQGLPPGLLFSEKIGTSGLDLSFAPVTTPEPGTVAAILVGFAALLARRRQSTRGRTLPSSSRTAHPASCRAPARTAGP
jgi:T5SS/PEP-CTERM-associated repeat protein